LFGEIEDEHDSQEFLEEQLTENSVHFSARLEVDYLNESYDLNIPKEEAYETLGGFIINATENIPLQNEIVAIGNFEFEILKVSASKIEEIRLRVLDKED
jgi:CBS domain containing-hemolysin-like protein